MRPTAGADRVRDAGSALLLTVVATLVASGVGLIAVLAVTRSVGTEARAARQQVVDALAGSGTEEAFGRVVLAAGDIEVLNTHPAMGPEPIDGDDQQVLGPWVRFAATGQILACDDARDACFTLRSASDVDLGGGDEPTAAAPAVVVIEATARQCRTETAESCVWARRQLTIRARPFVQHVLWVGDASAATFVGDGAEVTDRVLGDIVVGSGSVVVCGAPQVAVDTSGDERVDFRVETAADPSVQVRDGCDTELSAATVGFEVAGADPLDPPNPDGDVLATLAGIGGLSVTQSGAEPVAISFSDAVDTDGLVRTQVFVDGEPEELPATGLIRVDGDVSLGVSDPIRSSLTLVATGDIEITASLRVFVDETSDRGERMIGLVSVGGNVTVAFADSDQQTDLVIEAVIVATGCVDDGQGGCSDDAGVFGATGTLEGCQAIIEAGDDEAGDDEAGDDENGEPPAPPEPTIPEIPCVVAELEVFGAVVARELGPVADASSTGIIQRGFVKHYRYDPRLAWMQPPFAVEQVRGRWIRVDSVRTAPLGDGLDQLAATTTTTTTTSTTTTVAP